MIHPHSGTTICRSKRFNSMFRRALLLLGFCRRKYKAGSLSRMSVPLMTAGFSDAALDCRGFKQARFQPEATRSRSTEEGPPHGSPSIEHHCTWLPARRPYTAGIGTAIEVDARARSGTHLKPRPFPLASLHRASLLQISGFSLNIASALPCRLYSIPESPSSLLILPYGGAALHQRAEESIAFQSGVAESTVLQMMTMQQTISRGPGMAPVKAPNTTAQAE